MAENPADHAQPAPAPQANPPQAIPPDVLAVFRCPVTRSGLTQDGGWLVANKPEGAGLRYPIRNGIPVLLMDEAELPEGVASLTAFKAKYADDVAS